MWPMLLATFAMSAGQNALQGRQQQQAAIAQNKEISKANAANAAEAFQAVSSIEVQRGFLRKQTAKDLHLAVRAANESGSTVAAAAAAAGVRGASVDAVQQEIDQDLSEAQGEIEQAHINNEYNLNQSIRELLTQTRLNFGSLQNVPSTASILGNALVAGGLSAAGTYANQYFKFGSGTDNAATKPKPAYRGAYGF